MKNITKRSFLVIKQLCMQSNQRIMHGVMVVCITKLCSRTWPNIKIGYDYVLELNDVAAVYLTAQMAEWYRGSVS